MLQNRRRGFFLVGHAVTMRERRDVLRRVSEGLFSGERTRGLDAGSLEEADPVAALIWMHQTLSNKRVFHGLLSAPEMDPRLLDLWVEYSYSRGMWSELFELYDGLKRPRDAAAMLIAAAHSKREPGPRITALRTVLPYLLRNGLEWLHRQLKGEIEHIRRQTEMLHHYQNHGPRSAIFADFPVPPGLLACGLTVYHALIYLWTYHSGSSGDLSPVEFEKAFSVPPQRKAVAKLRARARMHDWASVKKIADQSVSTANRLLSALSLGSSHVVSPNNLDLLVEEVFANHGPAELLVYFGSRIPDQRRRYDVALRFQLWDVAIGALQTQEQAMYLLARLSKECDKNQHWIEKVVTILKSQR